MVIYTRKRAYIYIYIMHWDRNKQGNRRLSARFCGLFVFLCSPSLFPTWRKHPDPLPLSPRSLSLSLSSSRMSPLGCTSRRTTVRSLVSFSLSKVKQEIARTRSASRQQVPTPPAFSTWAAAKGNRRLDKSIPVVKLSLDPCKDFRDSMLHLIFEEEIFLWEDLFELLRRYLDLNSRRNHDDIICAFSEIVSAVLSM